MNKEAPNYLIDLIPKTQQIIAKRKCNTPIFYCDIDCFKCSFCPSTFNEQFKLHDNIRNSESIAIFENKLLAFTRPVQSNVYNISDPVDLKFLTRLRLDFSHLNEHRFRHNFQECINPFCNCSWVIEDTIHYLLHCHNFSQFRINLINSVKSGSDNFDFLSDNVKKDIHFYMVTQNQMQTKIK